jgi:hypothetical protein
MKWADMVKADGRGPVVPAVGNIFGLALVNHDNDDASREGSINWGAVLADAVWQNPQMHGTVEFLDDHRLKLTAANAIDTTAVNALAALYVPNDLPSPWLTMDVGAVGLAGNAVYEDGTWSVTGGGTDIWDAVDAFHFVFQTMKGDVEVTARIDELTESDPWTKGTLMIRDKLTAGSTHAIMAIASQNGQAFQRRPEEDGASVHDEGDTGAVPPQWLKLQRHGDMLTGWASADGATWDEIGSAEVPMEGQIYVGMAVTAHNNDALSTGTYSEVGFAFGDDMVSVEKRAKNALPTEFALEQNFPNPFNPTTTINFALPEDSHVKLTVYDITGRQVEKLIDANLSGGWHSYDFKALPYATGVYFYRLEAGERTFTKKMMLIK